MLVRYAKIHVSQLIRHYEDPANVPVPTDLVNILEIPYEKDIYSPDCIMPIDGVSQDELTSPTDRWCPNLKRMPTEMEKYCYKALTQCAEIIRAQKPYIHSGLINTKPFDQWKGCELYAYGFMIRSYFHAYCVAI